MAITFKKGDLLIEKVEALVNTVNTVGVMGKGIALQFKQQYPTNFKLYKRACEKGEVEVGKMFVTALNQMIPPYYIINFPTKQHWRAKSRIEYITEGLDDFIKVLKKTDIKSVAIPPLGCGNGGLNWEEVKSIISQKTKSLPEVTFIIYEPTSEVGNTKIRSKKRPKLTHLRAMLLAGLFQYQQLGYDITILEAQKIAYFLERFGNDFQLNFVKHHYGPYSDKLRHVLNDLDGFYISGMNFNTAKPFDKLILQEATQALVRSFIDEKCTPNQKDSLEILYALIQGFETPLGMELLSSLDFLIKQNPTLLQDIDGIETAIHQWNPRKRKLMSRRHLKITLERLQYFRQQLYVN